MTARAQHNVGGLVALALLEAIKLDLHANMREANARAARAQIVRANVLPAIPPRNGRFNP